MVVFDWLLGESYVGWLKTALLSGAFGFPLFFALYSPEDAGGSGRYLVIALGYPVLALVRHLYWNWREKELTRLLLSGDPAALQRIDAIKQWRPQLWFKLAAATRGPAEQGEEAASEPPSG